MSHYDLIQIGAHVGNDFLSDWIFATNPKGVLIEPVPFLFQKLKANYNKCSNLLFENSAISDETGIRKIFYLENNDRMPAWANQLASFKRTHIANIAQKNGFYSLARKNIKSVSVPCLTFARLATKYDVREVDLLCIDTEGHDYTILRNIDYSMILIKRIIFEYKHIDGCLKHGRKYRRLLKILRSHNYAVKKLDDENAEASLRSV